MMTYNIGQVLIVEHDVQVDTFRGEGKLIKAGTRRYVGADTKRKFVHYLNGNMQPLGDDAKIEGYSTTGLADWIFQTLRFKVPLCAMMDDYDLSESDFTEAIADALEELGMYDHTGNRN